MFTTLRKFQLVLNLIINGLPSKHSELDQYRSHGFTFKF